MLSKAAFNALLKTLEEPPEHVKFIFATTEIRKVPVTVLSRCQRFDLKRIEPQMLSDYYKVIAGKEEASIEDDALSMIARAADGSVRDGLSLLDQAIALGSGAVTAAQVKDMLGLADRAVILDLLEVALKGDAKETLEIAGDLYKKGADPVSVIEDMLSLTHQLTKHRAIPDYKNSSLLAKGEEERIDTLADLLPMPVLNRTWQILLKGLNEVTYAPMPFSAAEMVLLRLTYAANLPDPATMIKQLKDGTIPASSAPPSNAAVPTPEASTASAISQQTAPQSQTPNPISSQTSNQTIASTDNAPTAMAASNNGAPSAAIMPAQSQSDDSHSDGQIHTLEDVVSVLEKNGAMMLASQIFTSAHLVSLKEGTIEFRPADGAPPRLAQDLTQQLKSITGTRWMVSVSTKVGDATLAEKAELARQDLENEIMKDPLVSNIMTLFPGSKIKNISKKDT